MPVKTLFLIIITLFLASCSEPKIPQDVAADFWKGIQGNNIRLLYDSVSTDTVEEIKLDDLPAIREIYLGGITKVDFPDDLPAIREIYLGDTTIDMDRAHVVTVVELILENQSNKTRDVNLTTLLLNENGRWKVDYDTTVSALTVTSGYVEFLSEIETLSDGFQEKFNTVIDEYQKAIPEVQREFERLEEDLQKRIPEMQRRMEEFARDLEEAMKPPAEPPETIIEI